MKVRILLVAVWLIAAASTAFAQTTSFTYQGRLTDGGTLANGNYDLQFALWDSLIGGAQVGSTQTLNTVTVSNGVFTVSLDFGANAFTGASRFLEISARPSTGGSFTLLTPRQQITSTPYAVRSLNASSADSVPASGLSAGSGNYIQNSSSPQAASNFNISGNGAAGGTLTGNVVNAATQFNLGGNRILSNAGNSNLFAGVGAGQINTGFENAFFGFNAGTANTTGFENSFFGFQAGFHNTTGPANSFFGINAGVNNTTGVNNSFLGNNAGSSNTTGGANSFLGADARGGNTTGSNNTAIGRSSAMGSGNLMNATAIGAFSQVDISDALVLGAVPSNPINPPPVNVGIGTSAPTARLSIVATGDGARVLLLGTERAWVFRQFGTGAASALELTGDSPSNNNKNFLITTTGNVGIGTTSPGATLSVNGMADKPGGGSWGTFSDERLKNIRGSFTSGLQAVMRLQPLRYEYKPDNAFQLKADGEHVGFSAQAVQKVIPEAVSQTNSRYLVVNNDPILWTMLNAIKDQQKKIEDLKKTVARLQRRKVRH